MSASEEGCSCARLLPRAALGLEVGEKEQWLGEPGISQHGRKGSIPWRVHFFLREMRPGQAVGAAIKPSHIRVHGFKSVTHVREPDGGAGSWLHPGQ